jgi:hypothetical protein
MARPANDNRPYGLFALTRMPDGTVCCDPDLVPVGKPPPAPPPRDLTPVLRRLAIVLGVGEVRQVQPVRPHVLRRLALALQAKLGATQRR